LDLAEESRYQHHLDPYLDRLGIDRPGKEPEDQRAALEERQRELEDQSVAQGLEQYREQVESAEQAGYYALSAPGRAILTDWIEPLATHLEARSEAQKHTPGPCPLWIQLVRRLGYAEAAFLTLRALIDSFFHGKGEDEEEYERPTITQVAGTVGWMVKHELQEHSMGEEEKVRVGLGLLGECTLALPRFADRRTVLYRKTTKKDPLKTHDALVPTEETLERIAELDDRLSLLHPIYKPTVIRPRPWEPGQRGGYHYALRGRYPLVKPPRRLPDSAWDRFRKKIDNADMYGVYRALEILQNVAWNINKEVYKLAKRIQQDGPSIRAFASDESTVRMVDLLLGPECADGKGEDKQWIKRLETKRILGMAEDFLDREFFYPMKLDFRGRIYTVPSGLDPQGNDLARGLLTFAPRHAKPLGKLGRTFLVQHGVNMLDTDPRTGEKIRALSSGDRGQWVLDNMDALRNVARDPLGNPWWAEVAEPFQFYAFCVEMSRLDDWIREHPDDTTGEHFLSCLPISVDGSNNGMQHFCAMLRDEEGARAVNLVHTDPPEDLYQVIADQVRLECESLSKEGDLTAKLWVESGLLDRKLMKRPVMTFNYGVTKLRMVLQVVEQIEERGSGAFTDITSDEAAWFLMEIIWSALEKTVTSATSMRDWLTRMARLVGRTRPITWTARTGFPVMQEYYRQETKPIDTSFGGVRYQPKLEVPTEQINSRKQATSIAANFVHSLDAAALVETVATASVSRRVTAFTMIHDSYGTVPGDMEHLWISLRIAFKELYVEDDPVDSMHAELRAQYDGDTNLPPPPEKGPLNLDEVLDSVHFFA
jgi:DNA-directed RNA polymerase